MTQFLLRSDHSLIKNSSLSEGKNLIIAGLKKAVKELQKELGTREIKVGDINKRYTTFQSYMDDFFETHYPDVTSDDKFFLRKEFYAQSGVTDGKPIKYTPMSFEEILDYLRVKGIKRRREIPSKLYQHILDQKWMAKLLSVYPLKGVMLSKGGHFCRSSYELIIANLLCELFPKNIVRAQFKYPFDPLLNEKGQSLTCDFAIKINKITYFIEVWMYRPAGPKTWINGLGAARKSYLQKRQRKALLIRRNKNIKLTSVDVSASMGNSKSPERFFKDSLKILSDTFGLDINNPNIQKITCKICQENYAPKDSEALDQADTLLLAASKAINTSKEKLDQVRVLMESGKSGKESLEKIGLKGDALSGLCRLYKQGSWQVKLPWPTRHSKIFNDRQEGLGFSQLSFAKAITHVLNTSQKYFSQFSKYPDWVLRNIRNNVAIGAMGIFGASFRTPKPRKPGEKIKPSNYAYLVCQSISKTYLINPVTVGQQIHLENIVDDVKKFLVKLVEQLDGVLILNFATVRSIEIMQNRFLLQNPSDLELKKLSQDVALRILRKYCDKDF